MSIPWNPDLRENEQEFAEWQRNWQSMEHRRIVDVSKVDIERYLGGLGQLVSATISLAPVQYVTGLFFPTNECPLCGMATTTVTALPASVNAEFLRLTLGVFVWVHTECFQQLPLLQELPPFPA